MDTFQAVVLSVLAGAICFSVAWIWQGKRAKKAKYKRWKTIQDAFDLIKAIRNGRYEECHERLPAYWSQMGIEPFDLGFTYQELDAFIARSVNKARAMEVLGHIRQQPQDYIWKLPGVYEYMARGDLSLADLQTSPDEINALKRRGALALLESKMQDFKGALAGLNEKGRQMRVIAIEDAGMDELAFQTLLNQRGIPVPPPDSVAAAQAVA